MKALLLGGTGSIGAAVLNCLQDRGHEVLALGRSAAALQQLETAGAMPVAGDIRTPENWVDAVDSVDSIIHAAAVWDDELGDIDRYLVETILARLQPSREPKRFIYTGGCWLYGETGDTVATEETPLDPIPSFAWCLPTMQMVLSSPVVQGMVIHPAMVYERDGGVFRHIVHDAKSLGIVRIIGNENARWPLVHKDDLALVYVLMMEKCRSGDVFNASTIDGVPIGTITRTIAKRLGISSAPEIVEVATAQAEMGSWAEGYAIDQQMSGQKARDVLGWKPVHLDLQGDIG
jgi:nucleoside-diphosphate-sugar epimerase